MNYKTLEVFYDVTSIPGVDSNGMSQVALDFRNNAMDLIESALLAAEIGEWSSAEISADEVSIVFEVSDFEAAEKIIRKTVAGTPFEKIREIVRAEFEASEDDSDESLWDDEDIDDDFIEDELMEDELMEDELMEDELMEDELMEDELMEDELMEDELMEDELDRPAIAEALQEMGFEDGELLASLAILCHRLLPTDQVEPENRNEDESSHLGGRPDVPPEFEWPRHNGQPLAFIAQVDYFIEDGLLLFFFDMANLPNGKSPNHRGSCRVILVPREGLSPASVPADLPVSCQFPQIPVTMVSDINLPDSSSRLIHDFGLGQKDQTLLEKLDKDAAQDRRPAHHLMGHPSALDGDMELTCHLASSGIEVTSSSSMLNSQAESFDMENNVWLHLFQCDADPSLGWTFGNSGRLFFWINLVDFTTLDFSNVWAIVQTKPS